MTLKTFDNILQTIGNTPTVKLNKVVKKGGASLYAKVEFFNPGSSVKDRIALTIIEDAEKSGRLKPGGTIVEATSGNTGAGLALVATVKGYKTVFCMPDKVSVEKRNLLRALGSEVIITPTSVPPDSPESYYMVSKKIAAETPNAVLANQYFSQINPKTHYDFTAPEIWDQMDGKIDAFVAAIGTGGTISGVGEYLKEKNPNIKVYAADPYGSVLRTYKESGVLVQGSPYQVEGIGEDMIPGALHLKFIDEIVNVTDRESFHMSRRLTREEGIFCGGSSGTIVKVAVDVAADMKPEQNVVCIIPDTGERYLSKHHSDGWMREKRLLGPEKATVGLIQQTKPEGIPRLVALGPQNYVKDALKMMNEHNVSQLPVIDGEKSIGSLRENRLLGKVLQDPDILNFIVTEVMDEPFPVIDEDNKLENAIRLLKDSAAALVRDRDKLVGIITRFDVLEFTTSLE